MNFKIKIPLTNETADSGFASEVVSETPRMLREYGDNFRYASSLTNIPIQVLYSFAMVETRGNHNNKDNSVIVTGGESSTGIMQISPNMFYEIYYKENKDGRISDNLKKIVRSYVDIDFDSNNTPSSATNESWQKVKNALKMVRFNILASAIVLRRLLEESANSDMTMRMDKAIVKYNVGLYSKPTKTIQYKTGDTTSLLQVVPSITKNYIKNIVGKNGAMYYYIKNNIK
jgi:hypothetical protein